MSNSGRKRSDATRKRSGAGRKPSNAATSAAVTTAGRIVAQLATIEDEGGDGTLTFGRGTSRTSGTHGTKTLHVSSLDKTYFPKAGKGGLTKGDLMRYYASVSPYLLPVIRDRPLILKRYPDGAEGPHFFQQNVGDSVPAVVRTGRVTTETGDEAERLIGGDLATLLYTVQIGTIAVHPWQSRLRTHGYADTTTIDLDPGEDVPFRTIVELAKRIHVELDKWGLFGAIKTSGSRGLHIVLPLPPKTAYEDAARIAERIAERVVEAHPDVATLERSIKARPAGTIYVDAQQNAEGKSVVAAYSVREKPQATVSAPLEWSELQRGLRLEAFTIRTMPERLRTVGDLWGQAMRRRNTQRAIRTLLGTGKPPRLGSTRNTGRTGSTRRGGT